MDAAPFQAQLLTGSVCGVRALVDEGRQAGVAGGREEHYYPPPRSLRESDAARPLQQTRAGRDPPRHPALRLRRDRAGPEIPGTPARAGDGRGLPLPPRHLAGPPPPPRRVARTRAGRPARVARELAEEVGWSGPVEPDAGFVASFDYVSGSGRTARQHTFGLAWNGSEIVLSEEHTAYRWITLDELDTTDLTEESRQMIRDWAAAMASAV
ncbi:NUDIX domain-containing protein [Nocardiopsis mangrovi]|uniref:NUDIX domain-containing protein n=1 Tax=Nocardiopsis mangrovi TaxID=1179818 RepID=A0ABV9E095_9ACTN